MIILKGHDFKTLEEPIYVNNKRVRKVLVNGKVVYPEGEMIPAKFFTRFSFPVRTINGIEVNGIETRIAGNGEVTLAACLFDDVRSGGLQMWYAANSGADGMYLERYYLYDGKIVATIDKGGYVFKYIDEYQCCEAFVGSSTWVTYPWITNWSDAETIVGTGIQVCGSRQEYLDYMGVPSDVPR